MAIQLKLTYFQTKRTRDKTSPVNSRDISGVIVPTKEVWSIFPKYLTRDIFMAETDLYMHDVCCVLITKLKNVFTSEKRCDNYRKWILTRHIAGKDHCDALKEPIMRQTWFMLLVCNIMRRSIITAHWLTTIWPFIIKSFAVRSNVIFIR